MFETLSDEELISLSRAGNHSAEEALILRYTSYVRSFARPYFLAGGDAEDLIQEGMIGVMKAMSGYDAGGDASFKTFAAMCIRNRIYSAIRQSMRGKNQPLNNYIPIGGEDDESVAVLSSDKTVDPAEQIIGEESYRELLGTAELLLSGFEKKVLLLYLKGLSYAEISKSVGKPQKSVDNAVSRIRRKLAQHLEQKGDIR
ncbi:MAG: sigma-70 family RNA polymerase sigma factor [Oscillospiraceae bacterium]|nr:sigma-70 family RNA polymerase sigma factor [Oscillospiraceae bacterium]